MKSLSVPSYPNTHSKEVEGIVIQHPHDRIDACGVGEDLQLVITFKEGPVELPLAQESGIDDTQTGTVVPLKYGLARVIAVGFRREQVHEATLRIARRPVHPGCGRSVVGEPTQWPPSHGHGTTPRRTAGAGRRAESWSQSSRASSGRGPDTLSTSAGLA